MKILLSFSFFICLVTVNSCHNPDVFPYPGKFKTYLIKAGSHSSEHLERMLMKDELHFRAVFNETAIYDLKDSIEQKDINKLLGFTDCGSRVHTNSARFGWRWYKNRLEILAYCYKDGARLEKFITTVDLYQEAEYKITMENGYYIFNVNGVSVYMERGCSDGGAKFYLYPYFGGNHLPTQDIKIKIKMITPSF